MTCKVVAMIAALPACHRATRNYTDSLCKWILTYIWRDPNSER